MKLNLMPENHSRYPLAELTTIRVQGDVRALDNESVLLLTEIIENLKRVKRDRIHVERQEAKAAAKARKKAKLRKKDRKKAQSKEVSK